MQAFKRLSPHLRHSLSNQFNKFSTNRDGMTKKNILVDNHFNVMILTINRASKRNSLDSATLYELKEALQTFDNNDDAKVAILHGEGGNFSSGIDMDELLEKGYDPFLKAIGSIADGPLCKKPLIGCVEGYTVAEGFELALACDLRVIEDTASIGALGRRFGAPMVLGGVQRLTSMVGVSRALDLITTGRTITGETAMEWGLAARLVSTGTTLGQSIQLAMTIAKYPLNGVQHDKLQVYSASAPKENFNVFNSKYLETILKLRKAAILDTEKNASKFKDGLGKHGSCKNFYTKDIPDWEKENDFVKVKEKS